MRLRCQHEPTKVTSKKLVFSTPSSPSSFSVLQTAAHGLSNHWRGGDGLVQRHLPAGGGPAVPGPPAPVGGGQPVRGLHAAAGGGGLRGRHHPGQHHFHPTKHPSREPGRQHG